MYAYYKNWDKSRQNALKNKLNFSTNDKGFRCLTDAAPIYFRRKFGF